MGGRGGEGGLSHTLVMLFSAVVWIGCCVSKLVVVFECVELYRRGM
jgi:hypothetical protein